MPALGYRALVKMALAMLPTEEMDRFANTVAWLREPVGNLLHDMTVGLWFGNVGNAPPILAAALLRRTLDLPELPDTVFVTTFGFGLPADTAHAGRAGGCACPARPSITWTNVLNANGAEPLQIPYGTPYHLDWRRSELEPPSVESIRTIINPRTNALRMVPIIRQSAHRLASLGATFNAASASGQISAWGSRLGRPPARGRAHASCPAW